MTKREFKKITASVPNPVALDSLLRAKAKLIEPRMCKAIFFGI